MAGGEVIVEAATGHAHDFEACRTWGKSYGLSRQHAQLPRYSKKKKKKEDS